MGRDRKGRIDWVAFYYDPIENATMTFPGPVNGYSALVLLHYLYPQDPQLGIDLYESAMRQLGWSNPKVPVVQLADDPQLLSTALWMAREIGDTTTWERLREVSESQFEPRYFGEDDSRFAFWLGGVTPWPRGQINATMMMIECAEPGAWSRVFTSPNTTMYDEPTVRDLDYPLIGIRRTHQRHCSAACSRSTPSPPPRRDGERRRRSRSTTSRTTRRSRWKSTTAPCATWRRHRPGAVAIDLDIDTHRIRLTYTLTEPLTAR